jgi:hypothetical protein
MIYQRIEDSAACGIPFYYFAIEHDKYLQTFNNRSIPTRIAVLHGRNKWLGSKLLHWSNKTEAGHLKVDPINKRTCKKAKESEIYNLLPQAEHP